MPQFSLSVLACCQPCFWWFPLPMVCCPCFDVKIVPTILLGLDWAGINFSKYHSFFTYCTDTDRLFVTQRTHFAQLYFEGCTLSIPHKCNVMVASSTPPMMMVTTPPMMMVMTEGMHAMQWQHWVTSQHHRIVGPNTPSYQLLGTQPPVARLPSRQGPENNISYRSKRGEKLCEIISASIIRL